MDAPLVNNFFQKKYPKYLVGSKKVSTFAPANERIATEIGALAQLVEHRTENPCVPGSIPGGTTPPFIAPVFRDGAGVSFYSKNRYYGNHHWY